MEPFTAVSPYNDGVSSPVLYRKWRPQTLREVVGQDHVTRTLLNALGTGRVAHAYLLTGPRGTGKTSIARILAKAVNCPENGKGEPCDVCPMCRAIAEGRALDLIEIDAASNRGIDDIRSLRDKINFAPAEARYKVYVVDEVHMLTMEAFNALLKTLEEPPPYAIFVLATTEVHRVPVTILSRCQRFDFRRIPQAALVQYLERICEAEGIQADAAALDLIARSSNGGARDAVNLLEQAEVSGSGEVRLEAVQHLLGLTGDPRSLGLVKHIVAGSEHLGEGLALIQQVADDGVPLTQFGKEVASHLRSLLLIKASNREHLDLSPEVASELSVLVRHVPLDRLVHALRIFSQIDFRGESASSLPLELALVDAVIAPALQRPAERVGIPSHGVPATQSTPQPIRGQPAPPRPVEMPRPTAIGDRQRTPPPSQPPAGEPPKRAPASAPVAPVERPAPGEPVTVEVLRALMKEVQVPQNKTVQALLRNGCSVESIDTDTLVLGFREAMKSHIERIEKPDALRLAEAAVKDLTGTAYRIRCIVVEQAAGGRAGGHLIEAAMQAGARRVQDP